MKIYTIKAENEFHIGGFSNQSDLNKWVEIVKNFDLSKEWAVEHIKNKGMAQNMAIEYQSWVADQSLCYGELMRWLNWLETVANRFNLVEEFRENGVI